MSTRPPARLIGYTKAMRKQYARFTLEQKYKFWEWVKRKRELKREEKYMSPKQKHRLRQQIKQEYADITKPTPEQIAEEIMHKVHIPEQNEWWQHFRSI